ncbi:hypothetical protein WMF36_45535 [Sorangium sp. So ce887]
MSYRDPLVQRLFTMISDLLADGAGEPSAIHEQLLDLTSANSPEVRDYWRRTTRGLGVPDVAFKGSSPYLFPDEPAARTFRTSGTTRSDRGSAHYSARGLELMDLSILTSARRHVVAGLESPVILRLVPPEHLAPEMVMAHGMELIARTFGHRELSTSVLSPSGVDLALLGSRLDAAVAERLPVVLIGGSFAFVNVCDALEAQGRAWSLAPGSRMIDAGGFKGRSRAVGVDELRAVARRVFGIAAEGCVNLFGMTELASQLYDAADVAIGPLGERPKGSTPFVAPRVRDARSLSVRTEGPGLLEVVDLCVIDRPHVVLTGDLGVARGGGVAITGRIERGQSRGCSLALDAMTGGAS